MGRDSPLGFLAAFDRPPTAPVKVLNVDLSTVTAAADLVLGLGDPLEEILQLDFQASASAGKHADAWALLDDAMLARIAAAGMDGLTGFLAAPETAVAALPPPAIPAAFAAMPPPAIQAAFAQE